MDATVKSTDPDIVGRIMALEQKTRGLHGRVSALEMRFSGETIVRGETFIRGETIARGTSAFDDTEFVPGERRRDLSLESRIAALEAEAGEKRQVPVTRKVSMLDVTGLVVGVSMLAVGVLLATGSIDLLRNPLLAFTGGIAILACAAGRFIFK